MSRLPAALLVLAALNTLAQDLEPEEPDSWYRVEMIIFANRDPAAAASEQWPLLPQLAYPDAWRRIREGAPRQPADQAFELVPLEQQLPALPFELAWDKSIAELLAAQQRQQQLRRPAVVLEPLVTLDVPAAFVFLGDDALEFLPQKRRLQRSGDIDVLMHRAWAQPIGERERSLPFLVNTEVSGGDFPELQGSLLLYRARYLHIETDVWLNTDGSYLQQDWSMPAPPLPPESPPQAAGEFRVITTPGWLEGPGASTGNDPAGGNNTGGHVAGEQEGVVRISGRVTAESLAGAGAGQADTAASASDAPLPATTAVETTATALSESRLALLMAQPDYDYRHAVAIQQRRRMRSGELHYIDHPLLGILIKVSRFEFQPFADTGLSPDGADSR